MDAAFCITANLAAHGSYGSIATEIATSVGVRPSDWTVSCGGFDSLPGVVILELCRA
jgi:hypothetical protein